jgi:GT2 family glycosyltransferase
MDVSIIIVNYNTLKVTVACINSVFEKTHGLDYEVILVDNASTDGSKEYFARDKRIHYIYSERNGGFGYGNNRGMEVARGKYFFLLNSDTLLKNNAVKLFFDYAESHAPRKVYGCYLEGPDGSYRGSFHYFPAFTIGQFLRRTIKGQDYTPTYKDKEVECICGADMFLPRSAYDECGGFDEHIFLYGEEGEWQYRMMLHGFRRMLISTPKIIHLEGASDPNPSKKKAHWDSHFYVLRKYMHRPTYWLARAYYRFIRGIRTK